MVFPFHGFLAQTYVLADLHQGQANNHPTTPKSTGFSYQTTSSTRASAYILPLSDWLGGYDMSLRAEARYRYDAATRVPPRAAAARRISTTAWSTSAC